MPSGMTSTTSLADSIPLQINSARQVREFDALYGRVTDKETLPEGQGLSWQENAIAQMVAENVDETSEYDNPQMVEDSFFKITPTTAVCQTRWTKRAEARVAKIVVSKTATLAQNALERLKDETFIAVIAASSNANPGAGSVLSHTDIAANVDNIRGNSTEGAEGPIHTVIHAFQITDLRSEIVVGLGTYAIPEGLTEQFYRRGWEGTVNGSNIWEDNNIVPDSSDDAKGGTFAQEAIIMVQGFSPWMVVDDKPKGYVGRAEDVYHFDEYAFGVRLANWLRTVYSDVTAPA